MNLDQLTLIENSSIRKFLGAQSGYMKGRVLDFGCGRQPYRDLVEKTGAEYHPYDRVAFPCSMASKDVGSLVLGYETILCTQVVEFVPDVLSLLWGFRGYLSKGGVVILTGPTNMPEVNPEDLHRHTLTGITRLLEAATFEVVVAEHRDASHVFDGFELAFGWGCVALAR